MSSEEVDRIPLQRSKGCVAALFQTEVSEQILNRFSTDLLAFIEQHKPAGVVIDLSGVRFMDGHEFRQLLEITEMARIMGISTVICGFVPGVISSLLDVNLDLHGVETSRSIDDALDKIQNGL